MADLSCEALATKAELQELRDQLNEALGTKEDGSTQTLFQKGAGTTAVGAGLGLTLLGMAKTNAPNVITDIGLSAPGTQPIWKELSNGTAKLLGFKGNGRGLPLTNLNKVTKVAGTATVATQATATTGVAVGASMALLANLVTIAATLVLNIATVNILGGRIDAEARGTKLQLDALNNSMLRMYDKQQGDIDAVIADLDINQQIIRQNQLAIDGTKFEIRTVNETVRNQGQKIEDANKSIVLLKQQNQSLRQEIEDNQVEAQEVVASLQQQLDLVEANLIQAEEIITEQQEVVEKQQSYLADLEFRIDGLIEEIETSQMDYESLRQEFVELKAEISGEIDVVEDRVTTLEGKIAKRTIYTSRTGGGGGAAGFAAATVAQDGLIKLVSGLTDLIEK